MDRILDRAQHYRSDYVTQALKKKKTGETALPLRIYASFQITAAINDHRRTDLKKNKNILSYSSRG